MGITNLESSAGQHVAMHPMFSSTGLQTAILTAFQQEQDDEVIKGIELPPIVYPPVWAWRPSALLRSPYRYGCSLLCNHPLDPEIRQTWRGHRDSWVWEKKSPYSREEFERLNYLIEAYKSRTPSIISPRRSISEGLTWRGDSEVGGDNSKSDKDGTVFPEEDAAKNRDIIVLDLRRSKGTHAVSLVTHTKYDVKVPSIEEDTTGPKDEDTVDTITEVSELSFRKESFAEIETDKKTLSVPQSTKNAEEVVTPGRSAAPSPSPGASRRLRRRLRRSHTPEKDFRLDNLDDPGETQLSAVAWMEDEDAAEERITSSRSTARSKKGKKQKPIRVVPTTRNEEKEREEAIRRQIELELQDGFIDPKRFKELRAQLKEAIEQVNAKKHEASEELKALQEQMAEQGVKGDFWLSIPKSFSKDNARFELPMDLNKLSNLTPLEYLSKYVVLCSASRQLYSRIFLRYQLPSGQPPIMPAEALSVALTETLGRTLLDEHAKELQTLLQYKLNTLLVEPQWCGVAALCERLFGPFYAPEEKNVTRHVVWMLYSLFQGATCGEKCLLEEADFQLLEHRLEGIKVSSKLHTLLTRIRNSGTSIKC